MGDLIVERIGGLGGFGLPGSRLTSRGAMPFEHLSAADQAAVEALFTSGGQPASVNAPHEFRYRITRTTPTGPQTIEAPEAAVPPALRAIVKDELN
ncbi:MAG TPA: protealysin inhibitor emfourin [Phenylobacterium sp.]|jgi:hypothetical protein